MSPWKVGVIGFCSITLAQSFSFLPTTKTIRDVRITQLNLFDGLKDAFKGPAFDEGNTLDADRETPIDRWMGWNTQSDEPEGGVAAIPSDFVDAMDEGNYMSAEITKPMGIVFEENDPDTGGIFVLSISEDGAAEANGVLKTGDQLVAVNNQKVIGLPFDVALGAIVETETEHTKLTVFRGPSSQLYGPTGASKAWLDEFLEGSNQ